MAVVIIGSGIAALTCALSFSKSTEIIILTKGQLAHSNSALAQGGIAASTEDVGDINSHIIDTLVAGKETNNREVVDYMINNSAGAITFLKEHGVNFDMKNNQIHLTREGGHLKRRILHVGGDQSGKLMVASLINQVENARNIQIVEHVRVVEFQENKLIYFQANEVKTISANYYVIATGGASGLYSCTTATAENTGDYLTLAQSGNLNLQDMHLIQFHPTTYQSEKQKQAFLITEAVRGEGAYLVNESGNRFLMDEHELIELAPRDIVARAIFKQLEQNQKVYIDARHLSEELIEERFIQINQFLKTEFLNLKTDLIPIKPAAHYQLGGIATTKEGKTSNEQIYAIGECACTGFHGNNRLASNSLLECVIMGMGAAKHIDAQQIIDDQFATTVIAKVTTEGYEKEITYLNQVLLGELAIVRNHFRLLQLETKINTIINNLKQKKTYSHSWYDAYNLALFAKEATSNAINADSCGCHYKNVGEKC